MNRRHFLFGMAAPAALRGAPRKPVKITRIRVAQIQGRFHKFVSMNSFSEAQTHTYMPHGHPNVTPLLRIETDQGVEGVGVVSSGAFAPAVPPPCGNSSAPTRSNCTR